MASAVVNFRMVPPLDTELAIRRRDSVAAGAVAADSLNRYFTLLAAELRSVTLSQREALLLCAVLNGTLADTSLWPQQANQLRAYELEDSEPDGYAEQFEVELAPFVDRVRGWSRSQALAVVDAVERFWASGDDRDTDEVLAEVGLIRPSREPAPAGGMTQTTTLERSETE
jgi:hypothetical protein